MHLKKKSSGDFLIFGFVIYVLLRNGVSVSDLLAFEPLISCHWSSLILSELMSFIWNLIFQEDRRPNPFLISFCSSSFSEFYIHMWYQQCLQQHPIFFSLHLHGRKHFGNKFVFVNKMDVRQVLVTFYPHIYVYTLLPKRCLHLVLAICLQCHFHWSQLTRSTPGNICLWSFCTKRGLS